MATETLLRPAAAGLDAWLDQANPTVNHGSDDFMGCWRDLSDVEIRHALIQWDLSGLSVSEGSHVLFAQMMLHANGAATGTLNEVIGAHRITADWIEAEATWNNRKTGTAWGTAGGDCDVGAQDTQLIDTWLRHTADFWFSYILLQQVKDWLDAVDPNYGVLLKWANETAADSFRGFRSSDDATASQRPFLWVENDESPINLVPIGAGVYDSEWTGSAENIPRFEVVCLPPNLTGEPLDTFARSLNSGSEWNRQSFEIIGNLPAGVTIDSVKVCARLRNFTGANPSVGDFGVRVGGTDYYHGTPYTVYGAWTDFEREWTVDPSTSLPWTRAAVNALEPIIRRTAGVVSTRMCRCYVKVTLVDITQKEATDGITLGEVVTERDLATEDAIAVGEVVTDRTLGATDGISVGEDASLGVPMQVTDGITLGEAAEAIAVKAATDGIALGEVATAELMAALTDAVELQADVVPLLRSAILLEAEVLRTDLEAAVELRADVMPVLRVPIELVADVVNTDFRDAGNEDVIGPTSTIDFL